MNRCETRGQSKTTKFISSASHLPSAYGKWNPCPKSPRNLLYKGRNIAASCPFTCRWCIFWSVFCHKLRSSSQHDHYDYVFLFLAAYICVLMKIFSALLLALWHLITLLLFCQSCLPFLSVKSKDGFIIGSKKCCKKEAMDLMWNWNFLLHFSVCCVL